MCRVIAIANQKGGVGKTTTAINLGIGLVREVILHHEEGVDVIPSNKLLSGLDVSLIMAEDRERILREYLTLLKDDYDFMIIDCMPSLGMLTINVLTAADSVLIPMEPEYYAADGLMELLKVYSAIKAKLNPDLKIEGISIFAYDGSGKGARSYQKLVEGVLDHA